jgi:tetratricopeptide (TPR) repeat protein
MMRLACLALLMGCGLLAQSEKCDVLQRHGKRPDATVCYQILTRSGNALARAEGYLGLRQYQQANDDFREADKEHPNSAAIKTAWGNLYLGLEKLSDASDLFREAIKADANYAPAYLGLSKTLSGEFDKDALTAAREALVHDPKYFPAHEFLAYLALEDSDTKLATEEAQKAIDLSPEAVDGMAVLASIDLLKTDSSPWMEKILKVNPLDGEAYSIVGHFMEINYRYSEAIAAYRKAIELDPDLAQARSELGVNLMRIGQTDEAQKQLARCYNEHFQSVETRNSLKFLDTVNQYQHFTSGSAELIIRKDEAPLLRPYIEPELKRAMSTYQKKYNVNPGRVRLEVYPNHEDFVVRTLGLPGQGGLLGVTFGTVVAIDSPTAREPGEFSWDDTMWHELCHVYVIYATHNLVPRWFSEGLAVHEEGVASPLWGNRLGPDTVAAIKAKKLLPVLDLDGGFVRPQYPGQVLVSYFQAGKICDFIAERWGDSALLGMIHSYAAHKDNQQVIEENLHETPSEFDKSFLEWLTKKTEKVVNHYDQWRAGMKSAAADLKAGNATTAIVKIEKVKDFFPEYPDTFDVLARCYKLSGQKPEELHALEQYRDHGGTGVELLKRLAQLQTDAAQPQQAIRTYGEVNMIYPEDQATHQKLGALLLAASRPSEAVQEYRAVLALKPSDSAAAHLDLARALTAAHQTSEAKDQVLLALEAAPNYKPAQQLLLQLSQ